MKTEGFLKAEFLDQLIISACPDELLIKMEQFTPRYLSKWD
jgi:hypothetical protein